MAASDPQGEMQFWDNGFPFQGVQLGTTDVGEMQYWFNGLPMNYIFPAAVTPPAPTTATNPPTLLLMGAG